MARSWLTHTAPFCRSVLGGQDAVAAAIAQHDVEAVVNQVSLRHSALVEPIRTFLRGVDELVFALPRGGDARTAIKLAETVSARLLTDAAILRRLHQPGLAGAWVEMATTVAGVPSSAQFTGERANAFFIQAAVRKLLARLGTVAADPLAEDLLKNAADLAAIHRKAAKSLTYTNPAGVHTAVALPPELSAFLHTQTAPAGAGGAQGQRPAKAGGQAGATTGGAGGAGGGPGAPGLLPTPKSVYLPGLTVGDLCARLVKTASVQRLGGCAVCAYLGRPRAEDGHRARSCSVENRDAAWRRYHERKEAL